MIELTKDQVKALKAVGISEADVTDGRHVEEHDVIVVTSAGQKVQIVDGVATIMVGPGRAVPEVVEAPPVVEPESVPAVEDLKPIEPEAEGGEPATTEDSATEIKGDGSGETLPPIDGDEKGDGNDTSDLVQSFAEMKVEQLKGLLRDRGLPTGGKKDELVDRLNAAE